MSSTVIYLRRSVADDDNPGTVSYDEQLKRCQSIAEGHGAPQPDVLVDWGRSGGEGKEERRPGYQELRQRIATGSIRWVVSYDLSRLSRSTKETLDLVDHAARHGAKVHVADLGILDRDDPVGKFTMTALAGANTLLRDMASKRSREQVAERKKRGLPIGRPPYGHLPGEDAQQVLDAFDAAGGYHAAAKLLNTGPLRTRSGGQWSGKQVHQVVTRLRPRDVRAKTRVRARGKYRLTGLLECHCGAPMRVIKTRWNVTAICGRAIDDGNHPRPVQITENKLRPAIEAEAAHLSLPWDAVEEARAADEAQLSRLRAKRGRIIDLAADGVIIDKADVKRRLEEVDREVESLGARSVVSEIRPVDWSQPEEVVNAILRAMWIVVKLDEQLMPREFVWRRPEWRA